MCYEHYHICKYCNNQYDCIEKNYICPTINFDADANMCEVCREKEKQDFLKLMEKLENEDEN
jgi:hypothetical protein